MACVCRRVSRPFRQAVQVVLVCVWAAGKSSVFTFCSETDCFHASSDCALLGSETLMVPSQSWNASGYGVILVRPRHRRPHWTGRCGRTSSTTVLSTKYVENNSLEFNVQSRMLESSFHLPIALLLSRVLTSHWVHLFGFTEMRNVRTSGKASTDSRTLKICVSANNISRHGIEHACIQYPATRMSSCKLQRGKPESHVQKTTNYSPAAKEMFSPNIANILFV